MEVQGKIKAINDAQQDAPTNRTPPIPSAQAFAPATDFKEEEHDDLPF